MDQSSDFAKLILDKLLASQTKKLNLNAAQVDAKQMIMDCISICEFLDNLIKIVPFFKRTVTGEKRFGKHTTML